MRLQAPTNKFVLIRFLSCSLDRQEAWHSIWGVKNARWAKSFRWQLPNATLNNPQPLTQITLAPPHLHILSCSATCSEWVFCSSCVMMPTHSTHELYSELLPFFYSKKQVCHRRLHNLRSCLWSLRGWLLYDLRTAVVHIVQVLYDRKLSRFWLKQNPERLYNFSEVHLPPQPRFRGKTGLWLGKPF